MLRRPQADLKPYFSFTSSIDFTAVNVSPEASFFLSLMGSVAAVVVFLVLNAGWINFLVLSFLSIDVVRLVQARIGRKCVSAPLL